MLAARTPALRESPGKFTSSPVISLSGGQTSPSPRKTSPGTSPGVVHGILGLAAHQDALDGAETAGADDQEPGPYLLGERNHLVGGTAPAQVGLGDRRPGAPDPLNPLDPLDPLGDPPRRGSAAPGA